MKLEKGTLSGLRSQNKATVLQIVRTSGPISRAQIAKTLNMSRSNVTEIVDGLLQEGLLREDGTGISTSRGGRRPVLLHFVADAKFALGIDIGGTKTLALLTDLNGNLVKRIKFPSHAEGMHPFENIRSQVKSFLDSSGIPREKIVGTGIGVPSVVDSETGEMAAAPALSREAINIKHFFEGFVPGPIYVDNDVNMGVIGECWRGRGKGFTDVVLLAVGTGIGAGIVLNGQVYRGYQGFAGEIGFMQIDPLYSDPHTRTDQHGPLEKVASGSGIQQLLQEKLAAFPDTMLRRGSTTEEVFKALSLGDKLASVLIEDMVKYLAFAIANVVLVLNPQIVILGGGVMQTEDFFVNQIRDRLQRLVPVPVPVHKAALGEDASAYGAAALPLITHGTISFDTGI